MKKSALISIAVLFGFSSAFAQIKLRTTKPVTTQEITKTNRINTSGTSSTSSGSTSTVSQPSPLPTQPDSFHTPYYVQNNYAKRLIEVNPTSRTFGFYAVDYNGDRIKEIAYKDFYLDDVLGWLFQSPDGFSIQYKSGHVWSLYSSIGLLGYVTVGADINRDRKPDLVGVNNEIRKIGIISSISPLNNVGYPVHQLANSQVYTDLPSSFGTEFFPFPGEFNGDGKGDLALWFYQTGEWQIALSNGNFVDFTPNAWISGWGLGKENTQPVTGDFNGDGYTDIAIRDNQKGTWSVAFNNRNQTFSPANGCEGELWIQGWATDFNTVFRSEDFNGDRVDDLASFNPNTSVWQYVLSSGSCFQGFSKPIVMGDINSYALVSDMNGDGKANLIVGNLGPVQNATFVVLQISLNTGK